MGSPGRERRCSYAVKEVRAICSQLAANSESTAFARAIRASGVQLPVAREDLTFGGRSRAYTVTSTPARCSVSADVRPSAPQPITAILLAPVLSANGSTSAAEPQLKDQPEPPWP